KRHHHDKENCGEGGAFKAARAGGGRVPAQTGRVREHGPWWTEAQTRQSPGNSLLQAVHRSARLEREERCTQRDLDQRAMLVGADQPLADEAVAVGGDTTDGQGRRFLSQFGDVAYDLVDEGEIGIR